MVVGHFPLKNKIAVITGGGSGINLSFAKLAIEKGARVVIADLKLTPDAETFVKQAGAKSVVFARCDVTKRADLENLPKASKKAFGDVPDVWIAGAGVFEPAWSNFWDDTEEDDYKQLAINSTHPIKLARIAIRDLLKANKKGVILTVASLAGYQGAFAAPLYCASKHTVVGFTRSMAELDRLEDIKIVLSAPGNVTTPLWTDHPDKMAQYGTNASNSISPETVADSMLSLIEEAKYPGGTCLEIAATGSRVLGVWNIAEPKAEGTSISMEQLEKSYAPILERCRAERSKL